MSSVALHIAATGMAAQQQCVNIIANNMANVQTSGFQKGRALFADLVYQVQRSPGAPTSDNNTLDSEGKIQGLGTRIVSNIRSQAPGTINQTERPLDLLIEGRGFFQVERPDGTLAYTRAGSLSVSPDGMLTTPDGYSLAPRITIPEGALEVIFNAEGQVFAKLPGQVALQNLGQMELATFVNPGGLLPVGNNLNVETVASGTPLVARPGTNGVGTISQGFLEVSNVDIVQETTDLIGAHRAYELLAQLLKRVDEMQAIANRISA